METSVGGFQRIKAQRYSLSSYSALSSLNLPPFPLLPPILTSSLFVLEFICFCEWIIGLTLLFPFCMWTLRSVDVVSAFTLSFSVFFLVIVDMNIQVLHFLGEFYQPREG